MLRELLKQFRIKSPVTQLTLGLVIYAIIALVYLARINVTEERISPGSNTFFRALIGVSMIMLVNLGYVVLHRFALKRTFPNLPNLLIMGLILFLLINPTTPLWLYPLVTVSTLVLKMFVRKSGKPVFNPAGAGIFATLLFTLFLTEFKVLENVLFVSWWGTSFGPLLELWKLQIPVIVLVATPFFIYFTVKFKKLWYAVTFLSVYFIAQLLNLMINIDISLSPFSIQFFTDFSLDTVTNLINIFLLGTILFFTFVMLVEPKTSPIFKLHQIQLGAIVAIILFSTDFLPFTLYAPLIITLLVANLIQFLVFARLKPPKKRSVATISTQKS